MTYLLDTDTCIYWIKDINSVITEVIEIGWE
jgi:tRNA(fMet)-specific endonuclease VapC